MKHVFQEIHERSMWQVAGLYLAFCWLVLQISQTLTEGLGLPEWVVPFALILLLIGFPIVLGTAFIQKGMRTRGPSPAKQSLADVGDVEPGPPVPVAGAARVWTWKRAMLGGASAFSLFAVVAVAWAVMRSLGIGPAATLVGQGLLEERDVILLADFDNASGDETLGSIVTEAMRVDLSQSEALRLADAGFIDAALGRMEREPGTPLTTDLAREIASREGLKALVIGDVASAGGGYVLTASVVTPEDRDILVTHRETARNDGELLDAIDALARRIRERIGEPLGALANSAGLEQVTTENLEALRAYTLGKRLPQSEAQRRLALFDEAIALDSTFAMAWNALGIQLANYGVEPGRAMHARTRAFELRDKLPPYEANQAVTIYYLGVTFEPRQAIPYLEAMIELDPEGAAGAMNNLGEAYRNLGDLDRAIEQYVEAIATEDNAIPFMNLVQVSVTHEDFDGARAWADSLERFGGPFSNWHHAMVSGGSRNYDRAEEEVASVLDVVTGSPFLLSQTTQWLAMVKAIRGRLEESDADWETTIVTQTQNDSPVEALRNSIASAVLHETAFGEGGRERLVAGLERVPLEDMDPVERPYLDLAEAWVVTGDPDAARETLAEFETVTPEVLQTGLRYQRHGVLGQIALAEGRFDEAIEAFRQSAYRPQELFPLAMLGRAFDAAGQTDSARVYLAHYLDAPHWLSVIPDSRFLPDALERKAELEYDAGDLAAAAQYYAQFVALWAEADAALQPRVRAAQARLQEIYDEIG